MRLKTILCMQMLVMLTMLTTADKVDDIIQDLKYGNLSVRLEAAQLLSEYYFNDSRAVEPLIEALKDKDPDVRSSAANGLLHSRDSRADD